MRHLTRAYELLLFAPVLLPLIIGAEVIYPYLVPKTLLFYALALLLAGAFLVVSGWGGRRFFLDRVRHPIAWIPGALLVLAYATSAGGVDFYRSFWSLFIRGDGLLMLTGVVLYFYLILISAGREFLPRLLFAAAAVGTLVALYGIGEWLFEGGRIGGLLGNAAFFANYLGITVFATFAASSFLTGRARRLARVGLGLQILAIFLTATRGAILALVAALFVALAYTAVRGSGAWRGRARSSLIALLVLAGLFVVFRSQLAQVPLAPIARFATIGTNDPDVASRLFIWSNMVREVAARPVAGVGAEHVTLLFDRFYDPTRIQEEWFDRSHNAFLDYGAQYGLFGILLYGALIGSFLVLAAAFSRSGERVLAGSVALLAVAYGVENFFAFDTISSFWLFLALLGALLAAHLSDVPLRSVPGGPLLRYGGVVAACALVVAIVPVSIAPARAAYDLAQSYKYQLTDPARAASYLSEGLTLGTYGDLEYGYVVYDMYTNQAARLVGEARLTGYLAARNILAANFRRYPYDARTALYYAHTLALAPPEAPADQEELGAALSGVIEKSPKRAQGWYILANLAITKANEFPVGSDTRKEGYEAGKGIIEKYIALVPGLALPHFVLAQLEYANGEREAAAGEAALGKAYYQRDLETARRAAAYYEMVNDFPSAALFLEEVRALDPTDYASAYDLAKIKYLEGDKAGAEAIVAELRAKNPAIIKSDPAFEAAITAYERSL